MRHTFWIPILITAATAGAPAEDYFPPPDANGGWRALQEQAKIRKLAGIETSRLDQAFEWHGLCHA